MEMALAADSLQKQRKSPSGAAPGARSGWPLVELPAPANFLQIQESGRDPRGWLGKGRSGNPAEFLLDGEATLILAIARRKRLKA
jgi:hypothetical protein